ncbi:MAG: hypothetical protein WA324_07950 [Bryobacteraceae bacterium]
MMPAFMARDSLGARDHLGPGIVGDDARDLTGIIEHVHPIVERILDAIGELRDAFAGL